MTEQTITPRATGDRCKCGCGAVVTSGKRWLRGHSGRGEGGYDPARHSAPADALTEDEWQALEEGGPIWADPGPGPAAAGMPRIGAVEDIPPGPEALTDDLRDAPPAHGDAGWAGEATAAKAPVRVTAAVRRDIAAKVGIPAAVAGAIWEARDPYCGGRFNAQRKAISEAVADLMCDSPFWLEFMTGPMGGYVKYVKLGAAVWPVIEMVAAHHVFHSLEDAPAPGPDAMTWGPPPAPDPARYPG